VSEEDQWRRLGSRVVFDGRVRLVEHDVLLPDGRPSTYLVDQSLAGAVASLLRVGDRFALTYQYRCPLDRWVVDLPGGGVGRPRTRPPRRRASARRSPSRPRPRAAGDARGQPGQGRLAGARLQRHPVAGGTGGVRRRR